MGEKKLSKSVFGYFKTKKKEEEKKVPMAIKPGQVEDFFCGFPYLNL